jgi:non-canonical purine NTP pyrophosphatase (RdgB/HAM1 family)
MQISLRKAGTQEKQMDLLLATRNGHKTLEFSAMLGGDFRVTDLSSDAVAPAVQETGRTFKENAILKAVAASQNRKLLVAADDSGLEVDALAGAPGIFSARYAVEHATDEQNIDKLLANLRDVPPEKRSARFRCAIALARHGNVIETFDGAVEGTIVDLPRGQNGFGYDPIFMPAGCGRTFAEMSDEEKNAISHRGKAIAALRDYLRPVDAGC